MVCWRDMLIMVCNDILQTDDVREIWRIARNMLDKLPEDEDTEYTDEMRDGH